MPYTFKARFGDGKGTNPEELIAAAHAGCFTMALSFALNNAGFTAEAIDTEAHADAGPGQRRLDDHRDPPDDARRACRTSTPRSFNEIAAGAKANCPVSKVLNATITLDATLAS